MFLGIQLFITGCDMLQDSNTNPVDMAKKTPCMEEVKNGNSETQAWTPGITTDLTVNVNNENVKIADVTVYTICGGCWVYVSNVATCWELKDIKIWIGKDINALKAINADPSQFPDLEVHSVDVGTNYIVFPYETGWYCGDMLNYAVWANAKDTCDTDCGQEETVTAVIGTWQLLASQTGFDVGDVKFSVSDGSLVVQYIMQNGWSLNEAHLELVTDLDDVPVAGNHKPIPGQFDYHHTDNDYFHDNTFTIPLSELQDRLNYVCNEDWIYALAHATVKKGYSSETAWAGDRNWGHNTWVKYLKFKMPCTTVHSCEYDAWGKGTDNQEFRDINVTKFGWYFQCPIICD